MADSFTNESGQSGASHDVEWSLSTKDLLELFRRKRKVIFTVTAICVALAAVHHIAYPSYKVTSHLLFESTNENSGLKALLGSLGDEQRPDMYNEGEDEKSMLVLNSASFYREFAQAVIAAPEYTAFKSQLLENRGLMSSLRRGLERIGVLDKSDRDEVETIANRVKAVSRFNFRKRGILVVDITTPTPELSAFTTNVFLTAATKTFSKREDKKLEEARQYIQSKISETITKMETTDSRIVNINSKNSALSLLAPQSSIAEKLLELKGELQRNQFTFEQNNKVISNLKAKLAASKLEGQENNPALSFSGGSTLYGLGKTIENMQAENEILSARIDTLKTGLAELLKSNLALPKEEQKMADLKRQKGLDYYVFDNLFKTLLQIEVKGLSLLNRVYPLQLVTPKEAVIGTGLVKKLLFTLFASIFGTCFAVYVINLWVPVIRTKKDIESLDVSFLGNVSLIPSNYFDGSTSVFPRVCNFNIDCKETLSFKQIRSRLIHLSTHSGTHRRNVVSMLSFGNNEGKSFLSTNLAACFAHMGKRTLLIDFDLRRAAISRSLKQGSAPGIFGYLESNKAVHSFVVKDVLPDLDLLPAGQLSAKSTERFSNSKFEEIITQLKPLYDYIIIDTAPLAVAHESLAIAQGADFVVLAATSWKTKKEYIMEALEEIRYVRKAAVHVLLNRTKEIDPHLVSNYYYFRSGARRPVERTLDN